MEKDIKYCASSFLMYRRVVNSSKCFIDNKKPNTTNFSWSKTPINNSKELEDFLFKEVKEITEHGNIALALSGGIDSAILAKMMPPGSTAYTFKCIVPGVEVIDETIQAAKYAKECNLNHKIIEITWEDMKKYAPILMEHKNAPIHSIEVQIYLAGIQAKKDGFDGIIYGETADVNYGGLSNILSKDWNVGDFIERYAYLKPWKVLKNPKVDFSYVLDYMDSNTGLVDVHRYLSNFDIIESVNSYVNACECANIDFHAPFSKTYLNVPLDLKRIRNGENKYLIREIFTRLYPEWKIPQKIPMPRPTEEWLKDWIGPSNPIFLPNCIDNLSGDEKWLVWALDNFLNSNGL